MIIFIKQMSLKLYKHNYLCKDGKQITLWNFVDEMKNIWLKKQEFLQILKKNSVEQLNLKLNQKIYKDFTKTTNCLQFNHQNYWHPNTLFLNIKSCFKLLQYFHTTESIKLENFLLKKIVKKNFLTSDKETQTIENSRIIIKKQFELIENLICEENIDKFFIVLKNNDPLEKYSYSYYYVDELKKNNLIKNYELMFPNFKIVYLEQCFFDIFSLMKIKLGLNSNKNKFNTVLEEDMLTRNINFLQLL